MKIAYREWNPTLKSLNLIAIANDIIREYRKDNYTLTLRQLYYQFVARAIIENSERSYKNLGNLITKGREAGLISWYAIEDRNRNLNNFYYEEDIMVPIENLPYHITFDRWDRQPCYVEVWVEKDALSSVIERACDEMKVPSLACKGYMSASEAWRAGMRFADHLDAGQECILIHLGDHDPSGIDMTRDNASRLNMFTGDSGEVEVIRIALNIDQVHKYNPPPNPTKLSDSRSRDYIRRYGKTSWELDALEPKVLEDLIKGYINLHVDQDLWEEVDEEEEKKRQILGNIYNRWDQIKDIVGDKD